MMVSWSAVIAKRRMWGSYSFKPDARCGLSLWHKPNKFAYTYRDRGMCMYHVEARESDDTIEVTLRELQDPHSPWGRSDYDITTNRPLRHS